MEQVIDTGDLVAHRGAQPGSNPQTVAVVCAGYISLVGMTGVGSIADFRLVKKATAEERYATLVHMADLPECIQKRWAMDVLAREVAAKVVHMPDHTGIFLTGEDSDFEPLVFEDKTGALDAPDKVLVSRGALGKLLQALTGSPHLIREMQATRYPEALFADNPINVLTQEFLAPLSDEEVHAPAEQPVTCKLREPCLPGLQLAAEYARLKPSAGWVSIDTLEFLIANVDQGGAQ